MSPKMKSNPVPSTSQRPRRKCTLKKIQLTKDSNFKAKNTGRTAVKAKSKGRKPVTKVRKPVSRARKPVPKVRKPVSKARKPVPKVRKSVSKVEANDGKICKSLGISPVTVKWLRDNCEAAKEENISRSYLYQSYLRHCDDFNFKSLNEASFGKLVHSVFPGLTTRRLGRRGNSKYHYQGLTVKPNSPLAQAKDDETNLRDGGNDFGDTSFFLVYLGQPRVALSDFPQIKTGNEDYPEGLAENDVFVFRNLYLEHLKVLGEALAKFELDQFEESWKAFWSGDDVPPESDQNLPKAKMIQICKMEIVQDFVKKVDYMFYQHVMNIFLPDVLRPIPGLMRKGIYNFTIRLEKCLPDSLASYPEALVSSKVSAGNALVKLLRRYTSLNQLAKAANEILENQKQMIQLIADLKLVDFHTLNARASWASACPGGVLTPLDSDIFSKLQTLDEWGTWLEKVVNQALIARQPCRRPTKSNVHEKSRQFLLRWSFYTSLMVRDLSVGGSSSLEAFHTLKLLSDEYLFYLMMAKVGKTTGVLPIEVFANLKNHGINSGSANKQLVPVWMFRK